MHDFELGLTCIIRAKEKLAHINITLNHTLSSCLFEIYDNSTKLQSITLHNCFTNISLLKHSGLPSFFCLFDSQPTNVAAIFNKYL